MSEGCVGNLGGPWAFQGHRIRQVQKSQPVLHAEWMVLELSISASCM